MNLIDDPLVPADFGNATNALLSAILDQSADCIKVIGLEGSVDYMNRNGQCAMEIDDFCVIAGQKWPDLWPEDGRPAILDAMERAAAGSLVRFEGFCPTAKGAPRWWDVSVSPLRRPDGSVQGFIATSRDITDRINQRALRDAMADEMRHRLRNNYVVVGSLLAAYARGRPEQAQFVRDMTERLTALGVAQSMKASKGESCALTALVPALITHFETPDCPVAIAALPDIDLLQPEIDALALVFGELAVNSTKHGALSGRGSVEVSGSIAGDEIRLTWTERSDRAVVRHERPGGQGLKLMSRVLGARSGGIDMDWTADGLTATIRMKR